MVSGHHQSECSQVGSGEATQGVVIIELDHAKLTRLIELEKEFLRPSNDILKLESSTILVKTEA